jgi:hypothetical protein
MLSEPGGEIAKKKVEKVRILSLTLELKGDRCSHLSEMVISFQKSSGAASDMMLAVMMSCFTPAACATSRIRVVPETAVYDKKYLL